MNYTINSKWETLEEDLRQYASYKQLDKKVIKGLVNAIINKDTSLLLQWVDSEEKKAHKEWETDKTLQSTITINNMIHFRLCLNNIIDYNKSKEA